MPRTASISSFFLPYSTRSSSSSPQSTLPNPSDAPAAAVIEEEDEISAVDETYAQGGEVYDCWCDLEYTELGFQIQCEVCDFWQHGVCAGFSTAAELPDPYVCDRCLEKRGVSLKEVGLQDEHKWAARNARPDSKLRRIIHYLLSLSESYRSLRDVSGIELETSVTKWQVQLQQCRSPQEVAMCLLALEKLLEGHYTWKASRDDWLSMVKSIASDPRKWTDVKELPEHRVGVDTGHRSLSKGRQTNSSPAVTTGTTPPIPPSHEGSGTISHSRLALLQLGFQYQAVLRNTTRVIRLYQKFFNSKPDTGKAPNIMHNLPPSSGKGRSGSGRSGSSSSPGVDIKKRGRKRKVENYAPNRQTMLAPTAETKSEDVHDETQTGGSHIRSSRNMSGGSNNSDSCSRSGNKDTRSSMSSFVKIAPSDGSVNGSKPFPKRSNSGNVSSPPNGGKARSQRHSDSTMYDFFQKTDVKALDHKAPKHAETSDLRKVSDVCFSVLRRALCTPDICDTDNPDFAVAPAITLKSIESRIRASGPHLPPLSIPLPPSSSGIRMQTRSYSSVKPYGLRSSPKPDSPTLSPGRKVVRLSKPSAPYLSFQDFIVDLRAICEFHWMYSPCDSTDHFAARAMWAAVESSVRELLSNATISSAVSGESALSLDERWFADISNRTVLRCTYAFFRKKAQRIPRVVGMRIGRRVFMQYPRKLGTLLKRRLQPPRDQKIHPAKGKKRRRLFYKKKNQEGEEEDEDDESTSEEEDDEEEDDDDEDDDDDDESD